MSKSVPRTSMVFNPDEMVLIGDSESDHMISVLNPKLTASKRAVLTAKASAIKAEPTKQRFAEVWWRVMLEKSLNMQPNPPLLLVAFQAASTKHWLVFIKPHGYGTLFPLLSVWVVVFPGWAACQALASLSASVATSCSFITRFSKMSLFLATHRNHNTQGYKAGSLMPVGGRLIIRWQARSREAGVEMDPGTGLCSTKIKFQTLAAKRHWKKTWRSVSSTPHLLHRPSTSIPLRRRFSFTGKALFFIFRRK